MSCGRRMSRDRSIIYLGMRSCQAAIFAPAQGAKNRTRSDESRYARLAGLLLTSPRRIAFNLCLGLFNPGFFRVMKGPMNKFINMTQREMHFVVFSSQEPMKEFGIDRHFCDFQQ